MGALIGALLVAGIGIIGDIINTNTTNYENKKRQEESQQWQEAMVDKQNEYNSPAQQMERYKSAGINPSTIGMASGSLAGGNLSASPSAVNPIPYQGLNVSNAMSNLMSAYMSGQEGLDKKTLRQARLEEVQKHIQEYDATIKNLNLNSQGIQIANSYMAAEKTWAIRESQGRVKKLTSEFGWNFQQIAESKQRVSNMVYELENTLPEEVKKIISERNLNVIRQEEVVAAIKDLNASAELKDAQTGLTNEQKNTEEIRQADLQQDVYGKTIENANRQDLIDKYLEKYGAEIKKLAAEFDLTEEQAIWYTFDVVSRNASKFMGMKIYPGAILNERAATLGVREEYAKRHPHNK